MSTFNIYDQAALQRRVTVALQTRLEQINPVVRQLVSVTSTTEDKIKLERMEVKAFGYAKPKAFGATPPIYVPRFRVTETEIELIPIHEMSPVDERTLRKLKSRDPDIVERAGADIVLRQTALQVRNEVGWDVMTMNAILTGQLLIAFADDPEEGFTIDYGFDPTHFLSVVTPWATLATAKPIDDLMAAQVLLSNAVGEYAIHFWMNSNTMRNFIWSAQAKELLTGFDGRGQFIPNLADVARRMYEPDRVQFHVSDSGYRGETYDRGRNAHTLYIPDNYVIATTSDPFEGEALVEVFDGMTGVPVSTHQEPDFRQGQQNWILLDEKSLTTFHHMASTRIPRINRPDCIAILKVDGT